MTCSTITLRIALSFLLLFITSNIFAESLIFSAPPRESVRQGYEIYKPLTDHLEMLLGVGVKYKHPKHWLRYQSDIKKRKYDIVFDGPHFASWRVKHLNHKPLIKLPGILQFYIVTLANKNDINKPEGLVYKKVCAIPPPNLTSVTLLQRLNDPVREPIIQSISGGMGKIFKALMEGKCEGAVLRSSFYNKKLTDEDRAKIKIIYTSPELPNQVITVSERVSEEDRKKIIHSLTAGDGMRVMNPIIKRFGGKNVNGFVKANPAEYDGYHTFLEGVVLGW